MLSFELNGDILHVTEHLHSWETTKTSHWYYDILNWRVSSTGKLDSKIDRAMDQGAIDWCKKYYLPKVLPVCIGKGSEAPLWRFKTLKEAEHYIATTLFHLDPQGVDAGDYYIDAPEEFVNPSKKG